MANNRKRLQGRVVSDKMQKTVVVEIEQRKRHRIYEKILISTKKVLAHDETDAIPIGAIVRIVESKPMSKRKRWAVEEVLVDPGNKVVESISDEAEIQAVEQIGIEQTENINAAAVSSSNDATDDDTPADEAPADDTPADEADADEENDES